MAKWEFLPNPGREEEGLGHAGIETFKGSPYPGIARECSQNSLDAAARLPDGSSEPVHLVFRLLSVQASDIPGLAELKSTLGTCLSQWKEQKKEKEFLERAIKVADQSRIPVLSIEDYGTTGLIGPATKGKPFHALVKSSGVSQKADADASGSFGIGKNAAFAISNLRTVFYSTIYCDGQKTTHLAQGKSILVSHDQTAEPMRSTGYWGKTGYMPVDDVALLPEWLRRTEVGTTVASIGFAEEQNWHWLMTESLIRNFFSAVNSGTIRFTVQWSDKDIIEIEAASLEELFARQEVREAAESTGTAEDLDFSAAMLAAMRSPDSEKLIEQFNDVGAFRLTILQKDGFPRRAGILRNGMYIADNLRHFNHPMARFPMSRDFVAVLEPDDRDTSGRVRDMESPRHDEISAERLDDLVQRKKLKTAMKKVGDWIRNTIRSATTKPAEADVLLDEMNRFFSKPSLGQSIPDPANKNDDPERPRLTPNPLPPKPLVGSGNHGESGSSGGSKKSKTKGGRTSGGQPGGGRGAVGGRGGKSIAFTGLRHSVSPSGIERKIAFTPEASAPAFMEISAVGVSNDEALTIRSINGELCSKTPRIELKQGKRINLDIEFDTPYIGPISIVLSSISEGENAN
ncbi:hypothetical protein OK348_13350 [Flavobacterium sp. MXW15]|uniref:ATP-binding protein n=1 Tax=Xanthomonas chitinilytica TaxID=2989819 RepID=A0ABT3JWY6_9XANT|nr:hypothetical protein [Xanthomonas sp. H13-6]MCW4455772.1 hypothetical protein [Flavobacterium sp. MXW15]MCW4472988.1 hypothetical protein [Xanthomonas sp. H13-6]